MDVENAKDASPRRALDLGRNLVREFNSYERRELMDYLHRADAAEQRVGAGQCEAGPSTKAYDEVGRRYTGADIGGGPLQTRSTRLGVTLENIERCMTPVIAERREQLDAFEQVRDGCLALGKVILRKVPECADRSEALRDLRAIRMWANSAIALDGEF